MKPLLTLRLLLKDRRGGPAVEFALLAPILIAMLMGVLMIGIYMQNYNSVRSIVFDTERYTVIEYQKENKLLPLQIQQVATAIGSRSPYNFSPERLDASVQEVASGMVGAKRFNLTVTYTPPVISGLLHIHPPVIQRTEAIIVPG